MAELAAAPRASMVVLWPGFSQQLVLRGDVLPDRRGDVLPDSEESVAAAWATRSDHLRQLARCNTDELAGLDRAGRHRRWAAFTAENPRPDRPPPGWATGCCPGR
ncbi:MAG: pdxH [Modestobacter sp.]|nr:pdxH [Modestobacter sp.]